MKANRLLSDLSPAKRRQAIGRHVTLANGKRGILTRLTPNNQIASVLVPSHHTRLTQHAITKVTVHLNTPRVWFEDGHIPHPTERNNKNDYHRRTFRPRRKGRVLQPPKRPRRNPQLHRPTRRTTDH